MKIKELKEQYIGKKLLNIIDIDLGDRIIIETLKKMTNETYNDVDSAKILLFEENKTLVFVDFDADGYRSGNWFLIDIKNLLDKGYTKGIKPINSVVRNIEYFEDFNSSDTECILITTDEYVIKMGQNDFSDYYPSNFFNIEKCKSFALGKEYEVIDRKSD